MSDTEQMEVDTITILTEDDREIDCAILKDFAFKGKKYYVLAEILEDDSLSETTWIYGYEEFENGEIELVDLEEKELVKVVEYYETLL